MSTERARNALKLFEEALQVPIEQRGRWLDDTCGEDPGLAKEVLSLLSAHSEASDFLESGVTPISLNATSGHLIGSDLIPGRKLGDFVIERQIGAGGMGWVYRARQVSLSRYVALKMLPPYLQFSDSARTRFRREIEAAARLQHRNIVAVYTTGEELGAAYYAMELMEGPALSEFIVALRLDPLPELKSCRLKRPTEGISERSTLILAGDATPQPVVPRATIDLSPLNAHQGYFQSIARLTAEVAEGLDYAHRQQIVHRDVKPSNLLFSSDGEIHISDFGLARVAQQPELTRTGEILGTPYYMAPEQVAADVGEIDGRTDVYALGATLFELLTLRPPFLGESRDQVTSQIASADPVAPRTINRQVPHDLEIICLKALEKQPNLRYRSAAAMADDLRRFAAGRPIAARPTNMLTRGVRSLQRYRTAAAVWLGISGLIVAILVLAYRTHVSESRWTDAEFDRVFGTAQFAAMEGDLKRADTAINQAEQLGASPAQLNLLRGQLALKSGFFQQACDELELAVAQLPESVAAHALLSRAYDANEQNDELAHILGRLEQLEPVTLQDYLLLGQAHLYNDFDAGIKMLNEAVQRDKTNVIARLVRGIALVRQANISGDAQHAEDALVDLQIASELLEPNAYLLSRMLEARLAAATAHELSGDDTRNQQNLEHAATVAESLNAFSENYRSHRWRAFYFDYIGDDEKALDSWRAMKNTRIAYLVLALFRLGQFDEALQLCDQRLQRYPGARFTHFFRALILSANIDSPDKLIAAFQSTGEETLDLLNAHFFNYTIFCLAGQLDQARSYCRSLRASGQQFDAHDAWRLELLNYTCGELSDEMLLERSADARLSLNEAHFTIGITNLATGHRQRARQHFAASANFKSLGMLAGPLSRAFLAQMNRQPNWPPWIDAQPE